MAHVAVWKKNLVSGLIQDMQKYPVVAIVDMEGIPGRQVQSMRAELREHSKLKMTKNNLILRAIDMMKKERPGIEMLKDVVHGQCAIVTTEISPFKLFRRLKATMTPAPAKEGQLAPFDIIVPKGPTPFGPGPIIGELQKIGLPTAIEAGKIIVKKETTLVKAGKPISGPIAAMLPRLEIFPMVVGMDLRSAYEDGTVYDKSILDVPDDYYPRMLAMAAYNALSLSMSIVFPTRETTTKLIDKAYIGAVNLSISAIIPTSENIGILLSKANAQMLSIATTCGYTSDTVMARPSHCIETSSNANVNEKNVDNKEEEVSEEEAAAGLSALFG